MGRGPLLDPGHAVVVADEVLRDGAVPADDVVKDRRRRRATRRPPILTQSAGEETKDRAPVADFRHKARANKAACSVQSLRATPR